MKRFLALLLCVCLLFSFAACSSEGNGGSSGTDASGTSSGGTAGDLQKLTLILDWTPNCQHTGFYVASKLGYYEEAGIELEIVQAGGDSDSVSVTASGSAQFGVSHQDTMAPALYGDTAMPVTAIAALVQHNTSGIISLKDSGITSPKGLEGKRYATWQLPVEQAMMQNVVEADGGDFSQVELIPESPTDVFSALETMVDSVWVYYAWDGCAAEAKGVDVNFFYFKDINEVFDYYTPVIIGNNDFMEQNPEVTKAFLEATKQGYEYAIENPEEAAEILLEAAPELDRDIVMASQNYLAGEYKAEVERWGEIDPERWNAFYSWLYEEQLIEEDIGDNVGFTNEYLPQ